MQDQGDNCRAHAVENRRYQLQIPEVDVESAQSGDDHKIWKNKRPAAGPCAPKACPQVGNIDADLDCEWTRQRLTNRDRFAHLVLLNPLRSETSSRSIWPTSATGPPNPSNPRRRK